MKIEKKTIYSWEEFRAALDKDPKPSETKSLRDYASHKDVDDDEWYGTKSWTEAMFLLDAGGWGLTRLERTKVDDKILDSVAPLEDYLTDYVPTVAGGVVNIEAATTDASPEHFLEEEETETIITQGKRLLTVYVNCWNHNGIPEDCYFHRGALIYKTIDRLESLGYGCEVIATFPCRSGDTAHVVYVKVKDFQEMLDADKLCIAMCSTFMMRRFLFHLQELEPEHIRKRYGYYEAGGYGTQIPMGGLKDDDVMIQQDSSELVFWYDVSGLTKTLDIEKAFKSLVKDKFDATKTA
tara:strand:- start:5580 stop:6464 length:885 start_codon:yes stop_codon:yes gene_type:complete